MKKKSLIIIIISIIVLALLAIAAVQVYEYINFQNQIITQLLKNSPVVVVPQDSEIPEEIKDYLIDTSAATAVATAGETQTEELTDTQIIDANMALLTRLYHYLQKTFLWDIDHDAVYEAMATAMFNTLDDRYTYYVTADKSEEYEEETTGHYGGLGFYFSKTYLKYQNPEKEETLYCNITQVFPNTPSSRGGIKAGDMITHINGESVAELEATDCAKLMKGEIGTTVTVTIKRKNMSFDLVLTRELITVPTVEYTMLDNNIGYIQILEFSKDTLSKVSQALSSLKNQNMKSLIIDLRDNLGGDVDVTLSIANFFIANKDLLTMHYKDESKDITFKANALTLLGQDVPIAVLINGGTASSAEILSSILKDNNRALLIGTKTYGKGIMQTISAFGNGWTSITAASFVPPSGNEIHKNGVEPDIFVDTITMEEDEFEVYAELIDSKIVEEYVKETPEYTIENVKNFVAQHPEIKLRPEVLEVVVRNAYYLQMTYDEQPIADTWFDPQIKEAIKVLAY